MRGVKNGVTSLVMVIVAPIQQTRAVGSTFIWPTLTMNEFISK